MKRSKGKPDKINELILKTKTDPEEGPDNLNSHPWIMFSFNWWFINWRGGGGSFEIGHPRSRGQRILDVDGQGDEGSWKLDNFHGCHMCIIPCGKLHFLGREM